MAELLLRQTRDNAVFLRFYNQICNIVKLLRILRFKKRKARFRPLVYICSPYAGGNKETNIANAQRYCRFAVDSGCLPLAPHLYFPQFMDDSDGHDHNTAMFMNMILMTKCAEVWVFGNNITKGMAAEIRRANETQKPVRYFSNKCKEVH